MVGLPFSRGNRAGPPSVMADQRYYHLISTDQIILKNLNGFPGRRSKTTARGINGATTRQLIPRPAPFQDEDGGCFTPTTHTPPVMCCVSVSLSLPCLTLIWGRSYLKKVITKNRSSLFILIHLQLLVVIGKPDGSVQCLLASMLQWRGWRGVQYISIDVPSLFLSLV